jgi:hypothetical protein
VPDELKKHYLSDGEAGQYSTNLDRNRYGNDDQYLFTGGAEERMPASSTGSDSLPAMVQHSMTSRLWDGAAVMSGHVWVAAPHAPRSN